MYIQADGSLAGTTAAGSATGVEEAPFYVMENAAGTADYTNVWNAAPSASGGNVTAEYLRNRNLYDWTYLYRCSEFQGCLRISSPTLGRGKIHSPTMKNITDGAAHKAQITFRVSCAAGADQTDNLGCWLGDGPTGKNNGEICEEIYVNGESVSVTNKQFAYIPISKIGSSGWSEVRLVVSGFTKISAFNFMKQQNTNTTKTLFFVDDIEVRLLD